MSQRALHAKRMRRVRRVRAKVGGNAARPRLAVFRSTRFTYAQLIDDEKGKTLVAASTRGLKAGKKTKIDEAHMLGELLAKKALAMGIKHALFDRRFYLYHGRVKAVAEGARKGGLKV